MRRRKHNTGALGHDGRHISHWVTSKYGFKKPLKSFGQIKVIPVGSFPSSVLCSSLIPGHLLSSPGS